MSSDIKETMFIDEVCDFMKGKGIKSKGYQKRLAWKLINQNNIWRKTTGKRLVCVSREPFLEAFKQHEKYVDSLKDKRTMAIKNYYKTKREKRAEDKSKARVLCRQKVIVEPNNKTDNTLKDIAFVANYLGIKKSHIRMLLFKNRIPCIRVGRLIRFNINTINEWLERNTSMEADNE